MVANEREVVSIFWRKTKENRELVVVVVVGNQQAVLKKVEKREKRIEFELATSRIFAG